MDNTTMSAAFAETAKLYDAVEKAARRYTSQGDWISLRDLYNTTEVQALDIPLHKVRYVVGNLTHRGNMKVNKYGEGKEHLYQWDLNSQPFILGKSSRKKAMQAPSKPVVIQGKDGTHVFSAVSHFNRLAEEMLPKVQETKDLELVFGETTVVVNGPSVTISRNSTNGRVRIQID